jgi:predicted nucleotide-binding protein (sugar kinase/HSP70/actin superfamily)
MWRIGIPRALNFYYHYPLWRTFLEEIGAELVVSPPTNRDIVAAGAKVVADVTCLPIKVYAGHVIWLRDQGAVDFILMPAIRSVEVNALHCAKFQALPDIVKATVPDCPPLLDIEIDVHRRKIYPAQAFKRLAYKFTWNPRRVRRAWDKASAADDAYHTLSVSEKLTYPEALARVYPGEWPAPKAAASPAAPLTIALLGHPYCLYDDYINHDLVARLRAQNVRLVTSEMVGAQDARQGVAAITGQKLWFFEDWMTGAGGHYLAAPEIDGLIATLAFTCGPDSAMVDALTRSARKLGRSCLSLVLDEHGSAAGVVTRLEAFVDMLLRQKHLGPPPSIPVLLSEAKGLALSPDASAAAQPDSLEPLAEPAIFPPTLLREIKKPVLGFPRMGTVTIPIKSAFRGIGAPLELGPPLSKRTISLGVRYSPEFICTPYKYLLGNMIEMVEAGADTLIYVDGPELCRNSAYTQLMRDTLHDLGYKCNLITTAILEDKVVGMAKFLRQLAPDFTWSVVVREIRLALDKMAGLDELEKQVQWVRARETTLGSVDKVWDEAQRRVDEALDTAALNAAKRDMHRAILRVDMDPARTPVKIATTGEYYAVLEPFFNLDLERELGKLGAEVHRTLMMGDWAVGMLILEGLGFPRKPHIDRAAKPYLRWDVSGEGWVTIGQTVIHAKKGFDGVVETLPFTCIPEITALNILPKVSRDYNIPVISFIFDEQTGSAGMKTRLEAFVDLLKRRQALRGEPPK